MLSSLASQHAGNERRAQRQLGRREPEGLARLLLVHAVHLIQDRTRLDFRHPVFGIALAVAHAHLGGLLGYRLFWGNCEPNPTTPPFGAPDSFPLPPPPPP